MKDLWKIDESNHESLRSKISLSLIDFYTFNNVEEQRKEIMKPSRWSLLGRNVNFRVEDCPTVLKKEVETRASRK